MVEMTKEQAAMVLDPESSEEAMEEIKRLSGYTGEDMELKVIRDACRIAVKALRTPGLLEPPGEPLTLEQLKSMVGKWVYIVLIESEEKIETMAYIGGDGLYTFFGYDRNKFTVKAEYGFEECGKNFVAYAYPPAHIDREAWEPCGETCRNTCMTCDHNADELFGDADYCKDCHRYSKWQSTVHKYCERCGRPKMPEAWAELEKRLRWDCNG